MTSKEQRLGFAERVAVDLFALALMVHSTVLAFSGVFEIQDAVAVSVAVGLMQRAQSARS